MNFWTLGAIIFAAAAVLELTAINYLNSLACSDKEDSFAARLLGSVLPGSILFVTIVGIVTLFVCWWFGVGYGD